MTRLLITFGLLIAFSFPVSAFANIFDDAAYVSPKFESNTTYNCASSYYHPDLKPSPKRLPLEDCKNLIEAATKLSGDPKSCEENFVLESFNSNEFKVFFDEKRYCGTSSEYVVAHALAGTAKSPVNEDSRTCPPDEFPLMRYGHDTDGDGKYDKCLDPAQLDNLSNCANQVGNVLPVLSNTANKVCKTDTSTGAICGYSKQSGDLVYKTDLEMNCFGSHDDEETPDYDGNKELEPDNCTRMGDNSMACREDPANKCDVNGNCEDQCGFVNGQFYCFEQCQGDECDQEEFPETPPVDCAVTPSDASCPQEPDPEFCAANPTHPTCTNNLEPCTGDDCSTGGGGGAQIDLKPVVDELKALNDKLDISTSVKDSTRDLGALDTVFDQDSIDELIAKTDTKKTEITDFVNSARTELASMFQFSASAGGYETITFDFTYGSYSSKIWEYFAANIGIIAAAVMFLAYLIAARVVLS
ncbi:hypothetical protein [Shewanella sp.]|uniref:hypothetical protein n=1 Tax=Shewanella sp. TaxID=50422 RepID=UPI004053C68C